MFAQILVERKNQPCLTLYRYTIYYDNIIKIKTCGNTRVLLLFCGKYYVVAFSINGMDISEDLFEKEPSSVELIPRGVEDILSDISDDLRKTLFASLDSIIPLSPRPAPREPANKIGNDVTSCRCATSIVITKLIIICYSSDELGGTPTFTSASTVRNNGEGHSGI